MRFPLTITVAIVALGRSAVAGPPDQPRYTSAPCSDALSGPSYATRQPSCEFPPRAPVEQPPPPAAPTQAMQQPLMAAAPGMFVQPPATGTVRGPVEQRGVEGASITFPSLTLRFPSIRFPAHSRSRSDARMEIDAAMAPYQQGVPAATAFAQTHVPGFASHMPMAGQFPAQAPVQSPSSPSQPADAPRQPLLPSPPVDAPRAPACDAPPTPLQAPSCDAYSVKQQMLEDKLRQIEIAEQRLAARLVELQRLSEHLAGQEARQQPLAPAGAQPAAPPALAPSRVEAAGEYRLGAAPGYQPPAYSVSPAQFAAPMRLPGIGQ